MIIIVMCRIHMWSIAEQYGDMTMLKLIHTCI